MRQADEIRYHLCLYDILEADYNKCSKERPDKVRKSHRRKSSYLVLSMKIRIYLPQKSPFSSRHLIIAAEQSKSGGFRLIHARPGIIALPNGAKDLQIGVKRFANYPDAHLL